MSLVLEEVEKVVEKTASEARRARQELARKIREFWNSPIGAALREALSMVAIASGYADEVKDIMQRVAPDLKAAAEATKIGKRYKRVWGKVVRE